MIVGMTGPSIGYQVLAIVGALGGLCGLIGLYYAWRQTSFMKQQLEMIRREQAVAEELASKFDEAVNAVLRVTPKFIQSTKGFTTNAYGLVFPDPDFRQRIESYLIEADIGRNRFHARPLSSDQLRLPVVQKTIAQVLDCVKRFKEENPIDAKNIGL